MLCRTTLRRKNGKEGVSPASTAGTMPLLGAGPALSEISTGPTEAGWRGPGSCRDHSTLPVPHELFFTCGLCSPSFSPTPRSCTVLHGEPRSRPDSVARALCDLKHMTTPLWACFFICRSGAIYQGPQASQIFSLVTLLAPRACTRRGAFWRQSKLL